MPTIFTKITNKKCLQKINKTICNEQTKEDMIQGFLVTNKEVC